MRRWQAETAWAAAAWVLATDGEDRADAEDAPSEPAAGGLEEHDEATQREEMGELLGPTDAGHLEEALRAAVEEYPRGNGVFRRTLPRESIDALLGSDWWASLVAEDAKFGQGFAVPTTLGRLDPEVIRWLLLRGYMCAYVASFAVEPWNPDEVVSGPARDVVARLAVLARPHVRRNQV